MYSPNNDRSFSSASIAQVDKSEGGARAPSGYATATCILYYVLTATALLPIYFSNSVSTGICTTMQLSHKIHGRRKKGGFSLPIFN